MMKITELLTFTLLILLSTVSFAEVPKEITCKKEGKDFVVFDRAFKMTREGEKRQFWGQLTIPSENISKTLPRTSHLLWGDQHEGFGPISLGTVEIYEGKLSFQNHTFYKPIIVSLKMNMVDGVYALEIVMPPAGEDLLWDESKSGFKVIAFAPESCRVSKNFR